MAHEITVKDVFGEVRVNGEKAWHGLGVEMPEGKTAKEGFIDIGLGWGTRLVPVTVHSPISGKPITDPDFMVHIREDTEESLGVVGKTYKAISNTALAEFMDSLVGADACIKLETAGSLRGGRRVFCTTKLPKTIEVVNNDILEMYVIGSNSHDGSEALKIYGSSIRVVCANTLAWSERESSGRSMFKFEHSGDVEPEAGPGAGYAGHPHQEERGVRA
jgi:phage/plasmid-like protein (TIGR03299 family)